MASDFGVFSDPGRCLPRVSSLLLRPTIMRPASLERRRLLRAAGVTLSLPLFTSLRPVGASPPASVPKKRMVCIGNMLGFYPSAFWPEGTLQGGKAPASRGDAAASRGDAPASRGEANGSGMEIRRDFSWGRTTASLAEVQDKLTLISGLDHGLKGGHFAIHAFLSGVRQVDAKSMPMANITVDQYAAERLSGQTRFSSLTVGSDTGIHGGCQLSWTRSGSRVPPITGPRELFDQLFVGTRREDKQAAMDRFRMQGSILDMVRSDAKSLERKLNSADRGKLDEYMTSVRDVEKRIGLRESWIDVPKPKAPFEPPKNQNFVDDLPLLYDLIALALQTDSTRIATLEIGGDFNPRDLGVKGGYHALSHHGQRREAIESLVTLETYQVEQFRRFIGKLDSTTDDHGSLLDQTAVLFGSGMGNANSHTNTHLPLVLAGGGFDHGRMLAFDHRNHHRPPLTNLFVSMLQDLGIETDSFATSTGTLRGLS